MLSFDIGCHFWLKKSLKIVALSKAFLLLFLSVKLSVGNSYLLIFAWKQKLVYYEPRLMIILHFFLGKYVIAFTYFLNVFSTDTSFIISIYCTHNFCTIFMLIIITTWMLCKQLFILLMQYLESIFKLVFKFLVFIAYSSSTHKRMDSSDNSCILAHSLFFLNSLLQESQNMSYWNYCSVHLLSINSLR